MGEVQNFGCSSQTYGHENVELLLKYICKHKNRISLSLPYVAIINTIYYKTLIVQHRYLLLDASPSSTSV